jgi:membrane protease YdiL (CAAX protease family)
MKRFLGSQAGAILCWLVTVILLAALLAPFAYRGGMSFGEYSATHELSGLLESLGRSCRRANIGRYFSRSLVFCALVLLPFLFRRNRGIRMKSGDAGVPCVSVPWSSALQQVLIGWVLAGGLLWGLGWVLEMRGAYVPQVGTIRASQFLGQVLGPGIAVPPLEEWLFRGVLLGLWLGFSRSLSACIWTSLIFAFVHFLQLPEGVVIADPGASMAGFELLGKVIGHIAEPLFFVTDFATLFGIGMILSWVRVRTKSLWFPIGLHAGWIMAFKGFNLLYKADPRHPLQPWGVGDSLRSGMLPLATLALTAAACHFVLKRFDRPASHA